MICLKEETVEPLDLKEMSHGVCSKRCQELLEDWTFNHSEEMTLEEYLAKGG